MNEILNEGILVIVDHETEEICGQWQHSISAAETASFLSVL